MYSLKCILTSASPQEKQWHRLPQTSAPPQPTDYTDYKSFFTQQRHPESWQSNDTAGLTCSQLQKPTKRSVTRILRNAGMQVNSHLLTVNTRICSAQVSLMILHQVLAPHVHALMKKQTTQALKVKMHLFLLVPYNNYQGQKLIKSKKYISNNDFLEGLRKVQVTIQNCCWLPWNRNLQNVEMLSHPEGSGSKQLNL